MLKEAENPNPTYPPDTRVEQMAGTWWVAHTKSRQEKAFAWALCRRGIGYFLPLVQKIRVAGGRRFRSLAPLFTSYVFVCCDDGQRGRLFEEHRLANVLEVHDQDRLRHELAQVQTTLDADVPFYPWPFLAVGSRCRVASGPLKGVEGTVERVRNTTRLVLGITMLGQAAALEIDAGLLEPAS